MVLTAFLDKPGEHAFSLPGKVGKLEGILTVPTELNANYIAFLGHPHSLQGGTMNNKVVTTLARLFKTLGIMSVRFNFRGVGESEGEYDAGIGESDDMLAIVRQFKAELFDFRCIFAGFSFGSYVTYRAAAQEEHALLITLAPSVENYDYTAFDEIPSPWIIVQGDSDDVVPECAVKAFSERFNPPLTLLLFEDTGHFFHGKLVELKERLLPVIQSVIQS